MFSYNMLTCGNIIVENFNSVGFSDYRQEDSCHLHRYICLVPGCSLGGVNFSYCHNHRWYRLLNRIGNTYTIYGQSVLRMRACYLSLCMVDGGIEQKIVCPPSGVFTDTKIQTFPWTMFCRTPISISEALTPPLSVTHNASIGLPCFRSRSIPSMP